MVPKSLPKVKDIFAPSRSDKEVQQAADSQRRKVASESSATNWLTGGTGVNKKDQVFSAAQLLGG